MDRQEGYYWVKYGNNFEIARWVGGFWFTIGYINEMVDYDFEHINEVRIKEPGELPD